MCPSCQEHHECVHKAQKVILKRKRARAYVAKAQRLALSRGKLRRLRKLRGVRRTRFNSRVHVVDALVLNAALMRKVMAVDSFMAPMKADSSKKQKKLDDVVNAWGQDAVYLRCRRALIIGAPCAVVPLLLDKCSHVTF